MEATYFRGPLFLNALRVEMGSESLFGALRAFAEGFHGDSATLSDFVETLGRAGGRDLEPLFQAACWGNAYPSYQVVSTRTEGRATHVTIRNHGDLAGPCPVRLSSASGERTELVTVGGHEQADFVFADGPAVAGVTIDPDGTAYQYHPDQRYALWKQLDRDLFGGRNWHYYNQSYAYYATGQPEVAIEVLSDYFARAHSCSGAGASRRVACGGVAAAEPPQPLQQRDLHRLPARCARTGAPRPAQRRRAASEVPAERRQERRIPYRALEWQG